MSINGEPFFSLSECRDLLFFFSFFSFSSNLFDSIPFFFFSFCSFLITGKTRGYIGILRPSVLAIRSFRTVHMPNMQASRAANRDAMLRGGPRMRYR
jgi:hypothetical protein